LGQSLNSGGVKVDFLTIRDLDNETHVFSFSNFFNRKVSRLESVFRKLSYARCRVDQTVETFRVSEDVVIHLHVVASVQVVRVELNLELKIQFALLILLNILNNWHARRNSWAANSAVGKAIRALGKGLGLSGEGFTIVVNSETDFKLGVLIVLGPGISVLSIVEKLLFPVTVGAFISLDGSPFSCLPAVFHSEFEILLSFDAPFIKSIGVLPLQDSLTVLLNGCYLGGCGHVALLGNNRLASLLEVGRLLDVAGDLLQEVNCEVNAPVAILKRHLHIRTN